MIGSLQRAIRPIVVLDQDEFQACFELAKATKELRFDDKLNKKVPSAPRIDVTLRNGDEFKTDSLKDLFALENKGRNPIKSVRITSGSYGSNYIRIKIGGEWAPKEGATISVQGEPDFCRKTVTEFERIMRKDISIIDILPSLDPTLVAFPISGIILHTLVGKDRFYRDFINGGIIEFVQFALVFVTITGLMAILVNSIQSYIYGRAVFYWSDGKTRYDRQRSITNYLFWIIPVAFLVNALSPSWLR